MARDLRRTAGESAMGSHEEMLQAVALEIERHLAVNDGAADSAEGIRAWWLSPQLRALPLEHVIAALERLEKRGVVAKRSVGVGFIYASAQYAGTRH
jgi:hypothetical protein